MTRIGIEVEPDPLHCLIIPSDPAVQTDEWRAEVVGDRSTAEKPEEKLVHDWIDFCCHLPRPEDVVIRCLIVADDGVTYAVTDVTVEQAEGDPGIELPSLITVAEDENGLHAYDEVELGSHRRAFRSVVGYDGGLDMEQVNTESMEIRETVFACFHAFRAALADQAYNVVAQSITNSPHDLVQLMQPIEEFLGTLELVPAEVVQA